jgi:uncharacterized protein (DUF305 family)
LVAGVVVTASTARGQERPADAIPQGLDDGPYVHMMAVHHEEGLRIASLGASKAANAGVKTLAARIAANRQTELEQLKHFMTTVAEDQAPANKGAMKKMAVESLDRAAGAAFDRAFVDMLIAHHQDALTMTRSAKLVMPAVQEFARQVQQALTAEIKELEALRKL